MVSDTVRYCAILRDIVTCPIKYDGVTDMMNGLLIDIYILRYSLKGVTSQINIHFEYKEAIGKETRFDLYFICLINNNQRSTI